MEWTNENVRALRNHDFYCEKNGAQADQVPTEETNSQRFFAIGLNEIKVHALTTKIEDSVDGPLTLADIASFTFWMKNT